MKPTTPTAYRLPLFATIIGLTLPVFAPRMLAQAPETTDTALHRALAPLRPGTAVRVSQDLSLVEGSLRRLNRHDFVLDVKQAEQTLALRDVDTLWVSRGRPGKGALIGGLVGLGIGLIAGGIAAPEGDTDTPKSANALLGGGVGLLGGAFLGLLVGSEVRYWDRTYPEVNQ